VQFGYLRSKAGGGSPVYRTSPRTLRAQGTPLWAVGGAGELSSLRISHEGVAVVLRAAKPVSWA
jgi:hypothetical protein